MNTQKMKIAVVGKGNVGTALGHGLEHAGHEVKTIGKDPIGVREIVSWGDVVILAVPFPAIDETVRELADSVKSKIVVDATNALTPDFELALGCSTSGAEELQKKLPMARVVKAFNTVFAEHMTTGHVKGVPLTLFVASDDPGAKEEILALGQGLGFDPVDAGPLKNARWLETLGYFNIQLGYMLKMGTKIGLKLVR